VIVGDYAGSAIGSANSRERKYRRGLRACPECGAAAVRRSAFPKGTPAAKRPWYCHDKSGGCGAQFPPDDPRVLEQAPAVDGVEACDLGNTLQKMAQKRALIGATLIATNASDFFTQELADLEYADEGPGPGPEPDDAAEPGRPASAVVGSKFVAGMLACIARNRLSLGRVLAHYGIGRLEDLPAAMADDARAKCQEPYAPWREGAEAPASGPERASRAPLDRGGPPDAPG
jgi:hypothetical protein